MILDKTMAELGFWNADLKHKIQKRIGGFGNLGIMGFSFINLIISIFTNSSIPKFLNS